MNRNDFPALAVFGLVSCMSAQALCASPAFAPAAVAESERTQPVLHIKNLLQHWVHSSEEERPGGKVRVFRPAGSMKFPPSRFRMAYKFARNGSCELYILSPDDAHYFKACEWVIDAHRNTILTISAQGVTTSYRISELSGTVLRLAPIESGRTR